MKVTVGQQLSVRIEDVAFGGEGVARADGLVIFVPFVAVGETVKVEITECKANFARARLLRVLEPSPERVPPACPHFGRCGGCQYQHLRYETQLRIKHKQVADLIQRIGGFDPSVVQPVIGCPRPYGYRNRIMVRSQWNKPERRMNVGFLRWDCGLVEDVVECKIAEPALNEELQKVRAHPPPKSGLKVVLRLPPQDWIVPPDSFFQNNFHLLPELVRVVREAVQRSGARHLIDLYCGVGFFGIELADAVESFVGVEYDRRAIRAAQENAARRNIRNGEFLAGKAEELLPGLLQRFAPNSVAVLVDPPRKGLTGEAVDALRSAAPAAVVYVSCHPATLARDLRALCQEGRFTLERVTPLDMFPQTQHVECVAELTNRVTHPGTPPLESEKPEA
ncbi:MAG: class I SAM-dependent RNA methyltransferase [Limisphaera sp.]|nr:class I SAM-dependent RNA methyltransferase [Limisphaera sp.]